MTKKEIIEYVMNSPANTNPNVLGSMLDGITEEVTLLTEESVTTQVVLVPSITEGENLPCAAGKLAYSELIDADTIQVTFEGKQYTCQKRSPNTHEYGASISLEPSLEPVDFSQFPFGISSSVSPSSPDTINNVFFTETAGTYQIKIEVPQEDGSSANEWSTAQVSFSNDSNYYYYVDLAYFDSHNHNKLTSNRIKVPGTDESTSEIVVGYTVPLYKNQYFLPNKAIDHNDTNYKVISGRITDTGRGLLIEGDGTIKLRGGTGK